MKPKRKFWRPPAPGEVRPPRGRPKGPATISPPAKQTSAATTRPLPVAPPGDDPELFRAAGLRVPLIYYARNRGIPLEDLMEGGRLWDAVCRGIYAYAVFAAEAIYLKAVSLVGNPIPGIHWGKCNLKMRETGENETEVKKARKITRVTWRLLKGGKDGVIAGGGDSTAGGGSSDGRSGVPLASAGVESSTPGDTRR